MDARVATPDDLPELIDMSRKFHAICGYQNIPFSELDMCDTLLTLMESGALFVVGTPAIAMVGGLNVPAFFNHDSLIAQELFWWSEAPGAGSVLLKTFEEWARKTGADRVAMVSLSVLGGDRVSNKLQRAGYVPNELSHVKELM